MLDAAGQAFRDIFTPPFRAVLLKCVGFTVALLALLIVGIEWTFSYFVQWPDWIETSIQWLGGLALVVGSIFLIPPVTSLIAGLYLDDIAAVVEREHYPAAPPGRELPTLQAIVAIDASVRASSVTGVPGIMNATAARILVVDDEIRNIKLLDSLLKPEGYEITHARSGPETLETVARDQPALHLLDVMMLGTDEAFELMLAQLLEVLTRRAGQLFDADRASILLGDDEHGELYSVVAESEVDRGRHRFTRAPVGDQQTLTSLLESREIVPDRGLSGYL